MSAAEDPNLLCRLSEIELPGSRGFRVGVGAEERAILLVRVGQHVAAYENHCPHVGSPLDWVPGRFLDFERKNIQCATHGARFRVADGFCFEGPCAGKFLTPVPIRVEDGAIYLGESGASAC
ncbi:MAG TPA: Rieske (2Fe-2S) protein [Stellaceae bacterium]|nr:Rieske (2Fe-2S) protein [Stellaceae bacterium]